MHVIGVDPGKRELVVCVDTDTPRAATVRYTQKLPLNRDKNGAANIGTNFLRLLKGQGPIRSMSEEDIRLHKLNLCFACD